MSFLNPNKEEKIINGLVNANSNEAMLNQLTVLQNEISVSFEMKVAAICGVNNDKLSTAFARSYAEAYARNGFSSLIIDANLYEPVLASYINGDDNVEFNDEKSKKTFKLTKVSEKIDAICMDKEIYPSIVYKEGTVQRLIDDNKDKYDYFIVIMPSIKHHKEISLISDAINSVILITQKDVTIKKDIFDAIQYLSVNQLPLAKTVVLK